MVVGKTVMGLKEYITGGTVYSLWIVLYRSGKMTFVTVLDEAGHLLGMPLWVMGQLFAGYKSLWVKGLALAPA